MLEFSVATDCLGAMRRLESQNQVVTMSTKFHPIVRELIHLKSKRFKSIGLIRVDAHQDDLKSFDKLSFLEQLNVKCDTMPKELTLKVQKKQLHHFL